MKRIDRVWNRCAPLLIVSAIIAAGVGCAGKPPLPKYASVETASRGSSDENFAALVPEADVVYFPVESASHGGRSDPAALLLTALLQTGAPIAIGWDLVDASQQGLLDELQPLQGAAREQVLARLELGGSGRAREFCRSVLRDPRAAQVRHLALAAAPALAAKVRAAEPLAPEEQSQLPRGYRTPAGDFESFTERIAATRAAAGDLTALYRVHLFSEQFAADKVAGHFANSGGGKLLAFLSQSDLEPGRGVPLFVAQKVQVRQLVLGSDRMANRGAKLLTDLRRGPDRGVEVVDGAPAPARE